MQQNGHESSGEMGMQIELPAGEKASPPAVDLAAWGRGEINADFAQVQRAIDEYILGEIDKFVAARFRMATSPKAALLFVIEEGLIDEGDARTDLDEEEA